MTYYGIGLKTLRQESGLTREVVAKRCGISQSSLSKIEAGISIPSIDTMIKLSNSLGVRLPTLLLRAGVILKEDTARALSELSANGNRHAGQMARLK